MSNITDWIEELIHKITNSPVNNTIYIFQFNDGDNEIDREEAQQVLNELASKLGRPDVKIITKINFGRN